MTLSPARRPVVAGTDGSSSSERAVAWAAGEAVYRGATLRIVHAFTLPRYGVYLTPEGTEGGILREEAEHLIDSARNQAVGAAPDLSVTTQLHVGIPAAALRAESRTASLVVVGSRGHGGFSELLTGSVAVQTATHTQCPTVIVPEPQRSPADPSAAGTVIVGVDGSPTSIDALHFGFEFASTRGLELTAAHMWSHPVSSGPGDMVPPVYDPAATSEDEERVLAESLAGWAERFPNVAVKRIVLRGHPAGELARVAQGAELLVVGSRGRGGFRGLLMGSVSRALVHHSPCPLAIVRHRPE